MSDLFNQQKSPLPETGSGLFFNYLRLISNHIHYLLMYTSYKYTYNCTRYI